MRSPNAFLYSAPFVLVRAGASIDSDVSSPLVLVESRRDSNGIYFHYTESHALGYTLSFSQLVAPTTAPRSLVETYIV